MSSPIGTGPTAKTRYSDTDDQARGGRKDLSTNQSLLPINSALTQPPGQLLKGAVDDNGVMKNPSLLLGIKIDVEAEVHLTARVKGDIAVGLY
ncbi:hypothetical protein MGN70_000613 [Eutypa lata]|uniref:Uncharacterized protein n=1 Tax=Eutypa lata (strain UCR-EL1) TaxID=1287681 RepID=M7SEC8_EUTLA|nr:hypothetical protein UCREL1_10538 [Eutypa lata UCREL1]KAI1257570.1 hypothetical protein MGN70_000613 [Eutypa lata]